MKIDGLDFVDWLHKIRREAAEERRAEGISGAEWLRRVSRESKAILRRQRRRRPLAKSPRVRAPVT